MLGMNSSIIQYQIVLIEYISCTAHSTPTLASKSRLRTNVGGGDAKTTLSPSISINRSLVEH